MTPEGGQLRAFIEEGSYGKVFECFDKKDGKRKVYHQSQSFVKLFKSYMNCCQWFQKSFIL